MMRSQRTSKTRVDRRQPAVPIEVDQTDTPSAAAAGATAAATTTTSHGPLTKRTPELDHSLGTYRIAAPVLRHPRISACTGDGRTLQFDMSGTDDDSTIPNTLRHMMLGKVPQLAISQVIVERNTTMQFDGVVAQRLEMVPLWCKDLAQLENPLNCTVSDHDALKTTACPACMVEFRIDVSNPGPEDLAVTTQDLVCVSPRFQHHTLPEDVHRRNQWALCYASTTPMTTTTPLTTPLTTTATSTAVASTSVVSVPPRPECATLMYLARGQTLTLRCIAQKIAGESHARGVPLAREGAFTYRFNVDMDEKDVATLSDEQKQQIVNSCPKRVFRVSAPAGSIPRRAASAATTVTTHATAAAAATTAATTASTVAAATTAATHALSRAKAPSRAITQTGAAGKEAKQHDNHDLQLQIEDANRCVRCRECLLTVTRMGKPNAIRITPQKDRYAFQVVTHGNRDPEHLVLEGLDAWLKELDALEREVKRLQL